MEGVLCYVTFIYLAVVFFSKYTRRQQAYIRTILSYAALNFPSPGPGYPSFTRNSSTVLPLTDMWSWSHVSAIQLQRAVMQRILPALLYICHVQSVPVGTNKTINQEWTSRPFLVSPFQYVADGCAVRIRSVDSQIWHLTGLVCTVRVELGFL